MLPEGTSPAPAKKHKTVFKLQSPYTVPQWPRLELDQQETLVKLFCQILAPIGKHRSNVPASRGKRKRAKKAKSTKEHSASAPLPRPPIEAHLTVGLNVTTKALEAQISEPDAHPTPHGVAPVRVVFLTNPQSAPQHAHLPVLAALAEPKVLLVPLSYSPAEKALCAALGLPRVGVIGLRGGAGGAEPLYACLEDVPGVHVPFLKESAAGLWLGTRIIGSNQAGPEPV